MQRVQGEAWVVENDRSLTIWKFSCSDRGENAGTGNIVPAINKFGEIC